MSRSDTDRLEDIRAAVSRCITYREHLDSPELAPMAYDAILRKPRRHRRSSEVPPRRLQTRKRGHTVGLHRWAAQRSRPRVLPRQPRHDPRHRQQPVDPTPGHHHLRSPAAVHTSCTRQLSDQPTCGPAFGPALAGVSRGRPGWSETDRHRTTRTRVAGKLLKTPESDMGTQLPWITSIEAGVLCECQFP